MPEGVARRRAARPRPLSVRPWAQVPECRPVRPETALQRCGGGNPPSSYYTRKPVDAMTREEVDRRRNADLNRTTDDPNLSPAEQRRRERARQAYEDAAHNHGHYGEAAH